MVDVGDKEVTDRRAEAACTVVVGRRAARAIREGKVGKGGPLAVAELAGVMGAKRTPELIPLCHPVGLDNVTVACALAGDRVEIRARARCRGRTGVEMEAMTGAAVAALAVYDMCKGITKGIVIRELRLLAKSGGRSGDWHAG
jgi:cyclic pyranopterin phosphate synthase